MQQQGEPDSAYIVNSVTRYFKLLGTYNKKTTNETAMDFTRFYFSQSLALNNSPDYLWFTCIYKTLNLTTSKHFYECIWESMRAIKRRKNINHHL